MLLIICVGFPFLHQNELFAHSAFWKFIKPQEANNICLQYTTSPLLWISLLSFFFLSLALAVFWLILWTDVIQYKIGELNLVFDPMLYVSVYFGSVKFMKTKNSCLFHWLTSVIKPLSKYFLSHSFIGKIFTWFYWRNKQTKAKKHRNKTIKENRTSQNPKKINLKLQHLMTDNSGVTHIERTFMELHFASQIMRIRKTGSTELKIKFREPVSFFVSH